MSEKPVPDRSITRLITVAKKNFKELDARSFKAVIHGKRFQGFVVKKDGRYYAYQNLCQHLPTSLDLKDDHFFNHEKTFLQCHMHGALYEITTGLCVDGPCQGARLVGLPLVEEEDQIVITLPETFQKN